MTRSRKKNPYVSNTCCGDNAGAMKQWKKNCNRTVRRNDKNNDVPSQPSYYKKLNNAWSAPTDGKHLWNDPKGYRK